MVLLLGSNGYVGKCFAAYLMAQNVDIRTIPYREYATQEFRPLRDWLLKYRPEFVINAAGYTGKPNVDACETERANTLQGNTVFPLRLAEICAEIGIPWGHVSSGCIFQGEKRMDKEDLVGFDESDKPNFSFYTGDCSFYSGTKALAEEFIHKVGGEVYIWRLRIPFDHRDNNRNYISKLLSYETLLEVRNSLSHLDDFVASCWATMERGLPPGIYNVINPGSVTTREVVGLIQAEGERRRRKGDTYSADRMLKDFHYFASEEAFMKSAAVARRSSCVLDSSKAMRYRLPLRPIREALTDALSGWEWSQPA